MQMHAYCATRQRLADEFAISARLYAEAVVKLTTTDTSPDEYTQLCSEATDAQDRSRAAFAAFVEHVHMHRCRNSPQARGIIIGQMAVV